MTTKAIPSISNSVTHSPKDPSPQVKTSVGITYAVLSEAILSTIKGAKPGRLDAGRLDQEAVLKFKDALFSSPRLAQWGLTDYPNGYAQWRIYASDDMTFVIVDKKGISIHRGERSRYDISNDPLIATSLFSVIEKAQAVVSTTVASDEPMTDEEQESYFDHDPEQAGVGLDEALADTHVEPLSADDAELIHDVTEEEEVVEDTSAKAYVNKTTSFVDAEVARVKEEYPELKDNSHLKPKATRDEVGKMAAIGRGVTSNLKSLQGRILTIMDAAIADKDQRAAVKTLINKEFRRDLSRLSSEDSNEA